MALADGSTGWDELPVASAARAGELVFAGARTGIGADGATDVRVQAERALEELEAALAEAGARAGELVDVVSFHADVNEITDVLDVARRRLGSPLPPWTPVSSTQPGPSGARVAINAIAHLGEGTRELFTPDSIRWWRRLPIAAGARKGEHLFVAGQLGSDADGYVNTPGDHGGQARNALNRVAEVCRAAGGGPEDVIELTSFHQDPRGIEPSAVVVGGEAFDSEGERPAWTAAGVPGLLRFGMLGQYRAIAVLSGERRAVAGAGSTPWPSGTGGPATVAKGGASLVAVAGQVAVDERGRTVGPGDPAEQARASVERMRDALEAVGGSMSDLVELVCLHKDRRSPAAVLDALREEFEPGSGRPAWSATGVTGLWDEDHLHALHGLAWI
jgi:enamine deaminase RidA (YjgF/YER057c/UK114 family)